MVAQPILPKAYRMTPAEYLAWEYQQEGRYEYIEGEIIEMAGESPEHNLIAGNIHTQINIQIAERPCFVYMEGLRVRVAAGKFRYPDVVAVCGQPQFADSRPKTLLNPQILIEVLSASTGDIDFIDKMEDYFQIDSVTDYLIAAQTRMWIAHYTRRSVNDWNARIYHGPADIIALESLDLTLSLAAVFTEKLSFPNQIQEKTKRYKCKNPLPCYSGRGFSFLRNARINRGGGC